VKCVSVRDDGDGVDLDEIVGRGHLADLDHGGSRRRRPEIFAPHFVDLLEVLHVADVDVDPADVVHAAAGLLDRGLQVFADLAGLRSPVAAALPSGRRAVMPEMKTMRPRASTMVAWEKWPDGWRIFAEVICCLGMLVLLDARADINPLGE